MNKILKKIFKKKITTDNNNYEYVGEKMDGRLITAKPMKGNMITTSNMKMEDKNE